MKKIIATIMVCVLTLGTLAAPSTASAGQNGDLIKLGISVVNGARKVGQGAQTFNDKVSAVRNIGKNLRRR